MRLSPLAYPESRCSCRSARDEGVAALRDGLRDVVAAGAAADGHAVDRPAAVAR